MEASELYFFFSGLRMHLLHKMYSVFSINRGTSPIVTNAEFGSNDRREDEAHFSVKSKV